MSVRPRFFLATQARAVGGIMLGFIELPITSEHASKIAGLPSYHHDPFDRLLIAQTLLMPARLLTADSALTPYSELVWLI
ncbi:MAG: hypothetical protein ABIN99_00300 [Nitrosospira sp.]